MIQISINNSGQSVERETSIASLLKMINQSENGIAIAINEKVVPKVNWPNTTLTSNDKVLIIQATQGG